MQRNQEGVLRPTCLKELCTELAFSQDGYEIEVSDRSLMICVALRTRYSASIHFSKGGPAVEPVIA